MAGMPEPSKNPMTALDLTKFTVPQLKAVCKEKKITAYSKLSKGAIIQKIIEHVGDGASSLAQVTSLSRGALHQYTNHTETVADFLTEKNPTSSSLQSPTVTTTPMNTDSSEQLTSHAPPSNICSAVAHSHCANASASLPKRAVAKRKAEPFPPYYGRLKQMKASNLPQYHINKNSSLEPVGPGSSVLIHSVDRQAGPQSLAASDTHSSDNVFNNNRAEPFVAPATPALVSAFFDTVPKSRKSTAIWQYNIPSVVQAKHPKRFVPLRPNKGNIPHVPRNDSRMIQTCATTTDTASTTCLRHLDFPHTSSVTLKPVTLPPSLSQRKQVTRLAVALAFVPPEDFRRFIRVSRLFRYAAYISAAHRLNRSFSGRRLNDVTKQYSQNATNMWPYLREREEERLTRQLVYRYSFLGQAMEGKNPIADRLWSSPDNVKQATIAVRFLLTRLYFQVSVGHEMDRTATISDVQEVIKGEVWSIEIHSSKGKELLYVLEATCEVVGHAPAQPDQTPASVDAIPLRADWSAYIAQCMSASKRARPPSLMERLKWTNHEEYNQGISTLWLSRTRLEGEIGAAKLMVAERYVLACVVSNSVSGRWMSSIEMEQDFNGLPSQVPHQRRDTNLHLFLPAHHHIESLHFTSSAGGPLHSALAVVQTPGREYYIFKDNGMQVGCEETGVAEIWMQLLGCDASGRPVLVE